MAGEPPTSDAGEPTVVSGEPRAGERVGNYRILDRLGEGGFAVVYLAEQMEPVRRRVALKIIKAGMDTKQVIARFEAERQALAVMDHPNVAKVFDAGITPPAAGNRPYFVMELVPGVSITEHCDRQRLDIKGRLDLIMQVCEAVQHAHQKGIIHRDLKPSNILVTAKDGKAVPKVIDFGVAKALHQKLTERTLFTEQGQLIGTPEYMSPEQAEMTAQDIDTRSDIYSLGVLLYELLTGALPFDPTTLRQAAFGEIQRIIREEEPPKPSTRLSSLGDESTTYAQKRRADPRSLERELRGDLDWITMKALEKDRTRRYETADGLAMDIGRHLTHEPVLASPPSAAYRTRKFVRRHKVGVAAAALVALALVAGAAGTTWQAVRATRAEARADERRAEAEDQRAEAERQAAIAQAVSDFLNNDLLASVDPDKAKGREVTVREVLDTAAEKIERRFVEQPSVEAQLRQTVGDVYYKLGKYSEAGEHLRRALALRRQLSPDGSLEEAELLETLAFVYGYGERDYRRAIELTRQALLLRERLLGPDDPLTLRIRGDLLQLEDIQRGQVLDLDDDFLAVLAQIRGKGETPAQFRELLEGLTLRAEQLWGSEQYEEALAPIRDEFQYLLANPIYAADVPIGLIAYSQLLQEQRRPRAAEALATLAVEFGTTRFGEAHSTTITTIHGLAQILHQQGRLDEAERLLVRALDLGRQVLGEDHPNTLRTMNGLATVLQNLGRFGEAEPLFRDVLSARRRTLAERDPAIASSLVVLGMTLVEQDKHAEAEPLLHECLEIRHKALPEGHWLIANTMSVLGASLAGQGKYVDAEPLLVEGYNAMKDNPQALDVRKREALERILDLYNAWGKPEKAAEWRAKLAAEEDASKQDD